MLAFLRHAILHHLQSILTIDLFAVFPKLTEEGGWGGRRKATLSKSVEIQGINYVK